VRDKNGCGIRSKEFGVLGIPEYFTPNQDGYNDFWQLEGLFKRSDFEAIIYVFDRYGKLLTTFSPRSKGWDGYYNGKPMPSNDYWYRVELADGKVFKGNFTLKR
jgi:gliding motility-associated-like protein